MVLFILAGMAYPFKCCIWSTSGHLLVLSFQESRSQLSHHFATKAIDLSAAHERNQRDLARLSRLESHSGAGGDIEAHATDFFALELQRRIGFGKMVVRADLNRSVAAVGDGDRYRLTVRIELDLAVRNEHFAGDHHTPPTLLVRVP